MTNIGIQISSVRAHLQTPEDVLESFRKVSKMGYKHIQIQWINPEIPIEFIHDALQETGLNCIGTQDYYDLVVDHLDEVIEANHLWGGTYITVSGIPERYQTYEGCLEYAEELNKLSIYLESKGLILNFHPRSKDVFHYDEKNSLEVIFENTHKEFQFLLDIYHIVDAGLDPVEWIHRVEGRNDLIHYKDGLMDSSDKEVLMPVGQGSVSWEPIFKATKETGIQYTFAEQETSQGDPFDCLEESYNYLKAHGFN